MITRTIESAVKVTGEFLSAYPPDEEHFRAMLQKNVTAAAVRRYPKRTVVKVTPVHYRRGETGDDFMRNMQTIVGRFEVGLKLKPKGER